MRGEKDGELAEHASLSNRTERAARDTLAGRRRGPMAFLPFFGPAVIASIAYMDPGNFATNIEAGSRYGYDLLWVVLAANIIAMIFQALSAKVGIATGESLASLCRRHFPAWLIYAMWIASEIAAIATDVAEFTGGAIGISLLFGIPLMAGLIITGIITYAILTLQRGGFRPIELIIGGFILIIGGSYVIELIISPPDWAAFGYHSVVPMLRDGHAVTLAVGIVGATVMPHAIYLHSSLTRDRIPTDNVGERRRILWFSNWEVVIALGLAGLINMAMLAMAARVFHTGHSEVAEIETAYKTLVPLLGAGAAGVFIVSLISAGFSSSVVGTMAGQTIMQDFVHFRMSLWIRRVITMAPSFIIIGMGVNPTDALVFSQVILSLVLPVPVIALIYLSSRRDIMGPFVNSPAVIIIAAIAGLVVLSLNVLLLSGAFGLNLLPD